MFIATLIAKRRLASGELSAAEDALRAAGIEPMGRSWVEADVACDRLFSADPKTGREAIEAALSGLDLVVQGEAGRRKKLLVADMDSTMIDVECIDELADYAGIKAQVAEITERAMRGELEFEAALRARVKLLAGLPAEIIDRCREERVRLTPGARTLVATMKAHGGRSLLVSGGFTRFADPIALEIGMDAAVANRLVVENGVLTGGVETPIVGAEGKRQALIDAAARLELDLAETLVIGDGANDALMLGAAGLGVSYRGKDAAVAAAGARIEHNDLTALLYAQGYSRAEWEAD